MSDNSATAVYSGTGLTMSGWRANAKPANPEHEAADCGHAVNETGDVVLEGETPMAAGSPVAATVPNFNPVHVQTPVTKRGLPSDHQANQNPLTAGRRNTAVHRQPHGYTSRGK